MWLRIEKLIENKIRLGSNFQINALGDHNWGMFVLNDTIAYYIKTWYCMHAIVMRRRQSITSLL